jgi:hypothetical protein
MKYELVKITSKKTKQAQGSKNQGKKTQQKREQEK